MLPARLINVSRLARFANVARLARFTKGLVLHRPIVVKLGLTSTFLAAALNSANAQCMLGA